MILSFFFFMADGGERKKEMQARDVAGLAELLLQHPQGSLGLLIRVS